MTKQPLWNAAVAVEFAVDGPARCHGLKAPFEMHRESMRHTSLVRPNVQQMRVAHLQVVQGRAKK
jgi:hypothetical protein